MRSRVAVVVVAGLLLLAFGAPAIAQDGPNPREAARAAALETTEASGVFSCGACSAGWIWTKVLEAWRYESGSEERVWIYVRSGHSGNYAYIKTADARYKMFIDAAATDHWIGLYFLGGTSFSNVRLWWY